MNLSNTFISEHLYALRGSYAPDFIVFRSKTVMNEWGSEFVIFKF